MRRLLVLFVLFLGAPVALAQDDPPKREIIEQSAAICRDLQNAARPHVRRIKRAEGIRGVVRHGRRFIRTSRPHIRKLADLVPGDGARRYRRFVNNTDATMDRLAAMLNALEARRGRLFERRVKQTERHMRRAKRAAKRYGLRRSCVRYVS